MQNMSFISLYSWDLHFSHPQGYSANVSRETFGSYHIRFTLKVIPAPVNRYGNMFHVKPLLI
jgi:hypothetical protein